MYKKNKLTYIDRAKETSVSYLNNLRSRETLFPDATAKNKPLNKEGIGTEQALSEFENRFERYIIASSGPKYRGFVIGGATQASIVGDWLTAVYDQVPFASRQQTGISTDIETETIKLLLELFGLPNIFYETRTTAK